ncbi:MAG: hypothetical protein JNJ59_04700 [Deltaproteobacteria bacterium]|nr:hypothetical protein [Deltaproteobacteria bacterium]
MNVMKRLALIVPLAFAACSSPAPAPVVTPPADAQALLDAAPRPAGPVSGEATLFLMADLRGVLRPCGCTVELQKGGFDRLIPLLAEGRKAHPGSELLHAGPIFYEDAIVDAKKKAQRERQAEVTADLVASTGIAVAGATLTDELASAGHLGDLAARAKLQVTAANLTLGAGAKVPRYVVHTIGGLRVGIFALAGGEELLPSGEGEEKVPVPEDAKKRVGDPEAAAREVMASLSKESDVVVLLSALGLRETKRLVRKVEGIDFAVAGGMGDHAVVSDEAELVAGTRVMQFHNEGRYLGRLTIRMVGGGRDFADASVVSEAELAQVDQRVARLEQSLGELTRTRPATDPEIQSMNHHLAAVKDHRDRLAQKRSIPPADRSTFGFIQTPIEWDLPQDPAATDVLKAFDDELARINVANAGTLPEAKPGQAVYTGTESCFECHAETRDFWKANEHAHAWVTLEKVNKTFDAECVSCHVTGYGQAGGSLVGKTAGREAVQCEACHGPGSKHVADPTLDNIIAKPTANDCAGCHNQHHSPRFQFGTYREHLLVPGHGKKK